MARSLLLAALVYVGAVSASYDTGCPNQPHPVNNIKPSVASGYTWSVAATGLSNPRSVRFDDSGNLWVLESGVGVTKFGVVDHGGACVTLANRTSVWSDSSLNHGLIVDEGAKRVIVSSPDVAYQLTLGSSMRSVVSGSQKTLVTGMYNGDHVTRTLLLVKGGAKDILVVSRGSDDNIDTSATDIHSGHAVVKAFELGGNASVDFTTHGALLGWGLRNDVGLARHPTTNELWSVENSSDNLERDGVDVHNSNPGEEMNNLGVLNAARMTSPKPKNYGYPTCFAAWRPDLLPNNSKIKVGTQFAPSSADDAKCAAFQAPRITFEGHSAPLDIKFDKGAKKAWVAFHGSWDASPPVGYKVGYVEFGANGQPVEPATSNKALHVVLANQDLTKCPGGCFRPSGLAFDKKGRLWIASNESGEIYVVAPKY